MNRVDRDFRPEGQAELEYLDGEFRVIRAGTFVTCAVSGVAIPLDALRYWSVDLQEAYASPAESLTRFKDLKLTPQ